MRLKSKLLSLNNDKATKTKIFSPANTEELRIPFKVDKMARVVGQLAQLPPPKSSSPEEERLITGVLVQNDFKMSLMAPEDLREYAGLTTTTIMCKQRITLSAAGIDLIKWALEGTFGAIEQISPHKKPSSNGATQVNGHGVSHGEEIADEEVDRSPHAVSYLVMGCVIVRYQNNGEVEVEWEGNMLNDGFADAVLAVLFTVESSPAAVKRRSWPISICSRLLTPLRIFEKPSTQPSSGRTQPSLRRHTGRTVLASLHVPRSPIWPHGHSHRQTKNPAQAAQACT